MPNPREVRTWKVLETVGRIDLEKVTEIIEYWEYEKDLPMPLNKLCELFAEYLGQPWDLIHRVASGK
jgi:hypothetical protein